MVEGHGIAGWLADNSVPDRRAKRAAKSKERVEVKGVLVDRLWLQDSFPKIA